jgi:hypothetical protein
MKLDFKKPLVPALVLTAVVVALNWVLSLIGHPVSQLYSAIQPVSAVSGTLGNQVLAWVGGIIPVGDFFGAGIVALAISAYLILLVGTYAIDGFKFPGIMKGKVGRIFSVVLYGTAVFYLLIVGLVLQAWNVWLGLAIHTLIAAYATALILEKTKMSI